MGGARLRKRGQNPHNDGHRCIATRGYSGALRFRLIGLTFAITVFIATLVYRWMRADRLAPPQYRDATAALVVSFSNEEHAHYSTATAILLDGAGRPRGAFRLKSCPQPPPPPPQTFWAPRGGVLGGFGGAQ